MKYKPTIGIEIHLELLTKTKMFDPAPVDFNAKPNTMISENSLGYPGSLPIVNKKGVELAIRACQLFNMEIAKTLSFDRKHYFYVDLPKGYQITQNYNPIGTKGFLNLSNKKITFQQLHIEEDTAKVIRKEKEILIDYNRNGNPLIEVVTNPDFANKDEVIEFLRLFKNLMFYGKISNAKLEEGSFRCDVNISLAKEDDQNKGQKVEIKNLNSFNNIKKAIDYEINRQSQQLDKGEKIVNETRRWDENKQMTISMRKKFVTHDYRFIRETNIMPISLEDDLIFNVWKEEGLNYFDLLSYLQKINFSKNQITSILESYEYDFIKYFYKNNLNDFNYFHFLLNYCKEAIIKNDLKENTISPKTLHKLTIAQKKVNLDAKIVKKIIFNLLTTKESVDSLIAKFNIKKIDDQEALLKIIKPLINDKIKEDYKKKPDHIQKYLIGQVLKSTQGKAEIKVVIKIINALFKK